MDKVHIYLKGKTHMENHCREVIHDKCWEPVVRYEKGIQGRILKALFRKGRFSHVALRHYIQKWKARAVKMRESLYGATLLRNQANKYTNKCGKDSFINHFRLWSGNTLYPRNYYLNVLKAKSLIDGYLKKSIKTPYTVIKTSFNWHKFIKTILPPKSRLMQRARKENMLRVWNNWKRFVQEQREQESSDFERKMKIRFLKMLGSKTDRFSKDYKQYRLRETLLRWRMNTKKSDNSEQMRQIKDGTRFLQEGCCRIFHNDVVDKLRKEAFKDIVKEAFLKMMMKFDNKAKLEYLRMKFKWWRVRVGDIDAMKKKFAEKANKYLMGPEAHKELIAKNKNDLVDAMKTWYQIKTNKALTIQDYCRSLLQILQKMQAMKRNKLMNKKFSKLSKDMKDNIRSKMRLWNTISKLGNHRRSATIIQTFLRENIEKLNARRKVMENAGEKMLKFLKLWAFNNIWKRSQLVRRRNLMVKWLPDIPPELQNEFKKKYLLKWWGIVRKMKEIEATDKINAKARAFRSNKRKNRLIKQRDTVNMILKRLYLQHKDKRAVHFELWKSNVQLMIQTEKAEILQKFCRPCYDRVIKGQNQAMIKDLVWKYYLLKLRQAMTKAGTLNKDAAQKVFESLENVFLRQPLHHILKATHWIAMMEKVRRTYHKIQGTLYNYFVPIKFKKWYNNAIGLRNDELRKQAEWQKNKDGAKFRSGLRKKNKFFEKHFQRLDKAFELSKNLVLKKWNKNAKLVNFSEHAERIQAARKGYCIRKKYIKQVNEDKVHNLVKILFIRNVVSGLKDSNSFVTTLKSNIQQTYRNIENRYSINNFVIIANNDYRNKLMEVLTGKKCFKSNLLLLRFWLNKWKTNADKINDLAKKIQNNYRNKKARDLADLKRRVNSIIMKKYLHCAATDKDKKQTCLRWWFNTAKQLKINEDAKKINAFCRMSLSKKKTQEFQKFFHDWTYRIVARRLNDELRLYSLKLHIQKMCMKTFIPRLINKTKIDKIRDIFVKKFYNLDEELKKLYKQHYLRLWRKQANKMLDLTKKIQNNYRNKKARDRAKLLKRVYNTIFKKYLHCSATDKDKLQTCLRWWNNNAKQLKILDDAKKIKNFCRASMDMKKTHEFQRFFHDWSYRIVARKTNNEMKMFSLKLHLQKMALKTFIPRLINKTKIERLQFIFVKKFWNLDEQLKKMFKDHYLRLWHRNAEKLKQREKELTTKIQTNFRAGIARKKANVMRRINLMLLKLLAKQAQRKKTGFRLWLSQVQDMKDSEASKKIKDFTRDAQKKLRAHKKKTREEYLASFIKITMNDIDKAEERPVYTLVKSERNRRLLEKVGKKVEDKRTDHLKTAFDNIKKYGDMRYECFHHNAKRLQHAWHNLRWRRHIWFLILQLQRLRMIAKLMLDRNLRFKYKAMKLWKKNMMIPEVLANAQKIKNFIRAFVCGSIFDKKNKAKADLQSLFRRNLLNHHVMPVLKKSCYYQKLYAFRLPLGKYIKNRVKWLIENRERLRILAALFSLTPSLRARLLRGRMRIWSRQAQLLKEHEAARKVQRGLRSHNERNRLKKIGEFLKSQIEWMYLRHDNLKKYYLLWWKAQGIKIQQNEDAKKIQGFTRKEWDRIKVKKNYIKLGDKLWQRWIILHGLDLVFKYKCHKRFTPLYEHFDQKLKRTGFDGLRTKGRLRRIGNLIKSIFQNFKRRDDILRLNHWFRKWRQTTAKYRLRDIHLKRMVKAVDLRDHIFRTREVADACIAKRLGKLLDTIRSKDAFKNIKWKANNKKILQDFAANLVKGREELIHKNFPVVKEKLLKLYVYKVFTNQMKFLDNTVQEKFKPYFERHFLNQFTAKFLAITKNEYKNSQKALRSGKPKNTKFNGSSIDPSTKENDYDTKQLAVPAGSTILNDMRKRRLLLGLKNIKKDAKDKKMINNVKKYVKQKAPLPERFNHLLNGLKYIASIPHNKIKFLGFVRRCFARHFKNQIVEPVKMLKQRYLIRLAFMHKNCNDKRTFREIVRNWRFHVMMSKFLKKKAEGVYKQMHVNYLNIVNSFFGESSPDGFGNGSLFNEVHLLNKNMGLYKNVDPNSYNENNLEEAKHDKIHKFYKFFGMDYKKPKEKEEENEHEDLDDENPDIYADSHYNSNQKVLGRYREDTLTKNN